MECQKLNIAQENTSALKVVHSRYLECEKLDVNYYPFGLEWDTPNFDSGGNSLQASGVKSKYTYNNKEFIDDLDINLHDYGFRYYDPAIARFTSIDPLAEDYNFQSGFAYAINNPILHRDIMGLGVDPIGPVGKKADQIASGARNLIGSALQGLVSAGQSAVSFFEGLFQDGAGSDQTKGVPLEGKDGQGNVTTKSIEAPEEGIEVDGLMSIAKSKQPFSSKKWTFSRGKEEDIMKMTKKALEVADATDKTKKAVGHMKNTDKGVKELSSGVSKSDSLISTERRGTMTVETHIPKKKKQ